MRTLILTLAAALLLVGCGDQSPDDDRTATDPGTSASPTATPTATPTTEPTPEPTPEPTVGSYPSFAPQDYTYTLHVQCFCMGTEDGIRVTVEDGEVVDATLEGQTAQVETFRRLTINDVIDAANNTGAASVEVRWPAGQDYPRSVWVDRSKRIADEEIGYVITDVEVG